ncbi:MAG: glycosyltransferase [Candidatus Riflebacteria bacterium]|nr:glycosyltransferase [Candidatus Riflebacteria bacterium]
MLSLVPKANTSILYHGINTSSFNPDAELPQKAGKEPYFIYVSNIYVYKGLEYIIDAYKNNPVLPKTFVAGYPFDAKYFEHIKSLIEENKLQNKILFLKSVPHNELPGWYANAIAMVYTSWCENCPNILLEAQSCGCPIIAMKIGPMPEFCSQENILVEPFDGKALSVAMEKAIELSKEPDIKSRLLEHSKKFTWQAAMEQHKNVFISISGS